VKFWWTFADNILVRPNVSLLWEDVMTLRRHKHTAITVHAIRQRAGVPYHVERKVCSNCKRLLEEKTIKRAAA